MADRNDQFDPSQAETNRTRMQGGGVGAREMDQQRDPNRYETATNPEQRSFDGDLDGATNADRPSQADFGDSDIAARPDGADADAAPDRNVAGLGDVDGDLGAGTPANVDVHKLGQDDKPEQDWGDPADEGTMFSANHTRRGEKTEAERGQGAKTRTANKDIVSRRG